MRFISTEVPVYVSLGNHEAFPVDLYGGPAHDGWLYQNVSRMWSHWIDSNNEDEVEPHNVLGFGGYYSTVIRRGLRLVVLNVGLVDGDNWYFAWGNKTRDMGHQLLWLRSVLNEARKLK